VPLWDINFSCIVFDCNNLQGPDNCAPFCVHYVIVVFCHCNCS